MSKHTARRTPKVYREAGRILQKVKENGGSVKTLLYEARHPNLKALYALVLETLKHGQQLDYLVRKTQILVENPRLNPWLTRVLMTELLWQKKALSAVSPPQEIVQSYHEKFLSELANAPIGETSKDTADSFTKAQAVRYVRVNTLKDTTENVVKWFTNVGWEEIAQGSSKKDFLTKVQHLTSGQFIRDFDLPDLLVFPHDFRFYETDLFTDGTILLQDKASCTPPIVLNPPPGSIVLDMCAAPGMKATQLAALIGNKGTVYAVEINERRYAALCKTVEQAGATCVKTIKGDVLHQSNLQNVEFIILDPSCSGSGMLGRKSMFGEEEKADSERLNKLANFQCSLLRHAMTNYPKVKRIVYSTCSIHPEENEAVVDSVLRSVPPNFVPVKNPPHTAWMTRGSSDYEHGSSGFYANPNVHLTNGFFVAVFERSDCDWKPSTGRANTSNACGDELSDKKKKRKRKERTQHEPGNDSDTDQNPKKAEQTVDAVQKMLKAMQKITKPQLTSPEMVQNLVDDGNNGQLKKKKKTNQTGEKAEDNVKRKKHSNLGYEVEPKENAGRVENIVVDDESEQLKKSKKKKNKLNQNGEEVEDNVRGKKRSTLRCEVKSEENASHVEHETDGSTILKKKKRKKTLMD